MKTFTQVSKSEDWSREYCILALYNKIHGCTDLGFPAEDLLADFMSAPVNTLKMDKLNIEWLETGDGLQNASKNMKEIHELYKDLELKQKLTKHDFKRLAIDICDEISQGMTNNKFLLRNKSAVDIFKNYTTSSQINQVPQMSGTPQFHKRLQNELKDHLKNYEYKIGDKVTIKHKSWSKNDKRHCEVIGLTEQGFPILKEIGATNSAKEYHFDSKIPYDYEVIYPNSLPEIYSKVNLRN